ncbi:MAG: hypothetical protein PHW82_06660 [Bacteroidales bacterium]|nr:hypothetical protein [Bacteroidales bacterium]
MRKDKIIMSLLAIFMLASCVSEKKWEKARVVYYDDFEKNMFVKANKHSYYNFIKAKEKLSSKTEILIPAEVKLVEAANFTYMRLHFDEETYGMESYSFGHNLGGYDIMLAETKYQAKTCACKTSGSYFKGYFLVYNDNILKIKTDNKDNVYNRAKLYDFVERQHGYELPQDINTISDIIYYLENINN